jgi:hypothetical protein
MTTITPTSVSFVGGTGVNNGTFASPVVSASLTIAGHKVDIGGQFHGSLSQTLDTSAEYDDLRCSRCLAAPCGTRPSARCRSSVATRWREIL